MLPFIGRHVKHWTSCISLRWAERHLAGSLSDSPLRLYLPVYWTKICLHSKWHIWGRSNIWKKKKINNRPSVARTVLKTGSLFIHSFIDWLSQWSFLSRYSQHHKTQTVRARELKIWENIHLTSCVMCHISPVTFHLSPVMCHLSPVTCHFFFTLKKIKWILFFMLQRILTKWWSYSVEGLLSTGHTPSSFKCNKVLIVFFLNPAYGRQSISRPMRIVAPIPKHSANNLLVVVV